MTDELAGLCDELPSNHRCSMRCVMLNENKVKMMTKMAIYEKNEGRYNIKTARYFKADYVSLGVLKTVIVGTFSFILLLVVVGMCNLDMLANNLNQLDYVSMGSTIGAFYVVFIIVYGVISALVYAARFDSSRKELKQFISRLNKLERFYGVKKKK